MKIDAEYLDIETANCMFVWNFIWNIMYSTQLANESIINESILLALSFD